MIDPIRDERNGYRDYTEEDVKIIKKVAYHRTLGISVEEICRLSHQEAELCEVLKEQRQHLDIANYVCFVALSVETFIILFVKEILMHVTIVLFIDTFVLLGLLLMAVRRAVKKS